MKENKIAQLVMDRCACFTAGHGVAAAKNRNECGVTFKNLNIFEYLE
jgi:hypothetical protein